MTDWLNHVRQTYIDELVRHDSLGDAEDCGACGICNTSIANVRCIDCSSTELLCGDCMVKLHQRNPLHRVEVRLLYLNIYSTNGLLFNRNGTRGISRGLHCLN